jgi:hypothetical protein
VRLEALGKLVKIIDIMESQIQDSVACKRVSVTCASISTNILLNGSSVLVS